MLAPDSRALLLESLRPPLGHRLDAAVATTFTLDFTAALVAPLAFAAHEVRASTDPMAILEAVRSSADRVDVFCQAGQVSVPLQPSDLMAFLEPMIHRVRRPRPGYLFHPKVWVLRYASPEAPRGGCLPVAVPHPEPDVRQQLGRDPPPRRRPGQDHRLAQQPIGQIRAGAARHGRRAVAARTGWIG